MPTTVRDAAAELTGCAGCGTEYRPWRSGGVCPLCATPATADPLRAVLGRRSLATLDLIQSSWRLVLIALLWALVALTLVIVWTTDAPT